MHNEVIRHSVRQKQERSQQTQAQGCLLAETEAVFHDERALTIEDNDHDEQRWITLGLDARGRLLVVAYSYREANVVRVISARFATPSERCEYFLEA